LRRSRRSGGQGDPLRGLADDGAVERNADGRAELLATEVVTDQAEPRLAEVAALHGEARLAGSRSTPSAQNSLQA